MPKGSKDGARLLHCFSTKIEYQWEQFPGDKGNFFFVQFSYTFLSFQCGRPLLIAQINSSRQCIQGGWLPPLSTSSGCLVFRHVTSRWQSWQQKKLIENKITLVSSIVARRVCSNKDWGLKKRRVDRSILKYNPLIKSSSPKLQRGKRRWNYCLVDENIKRTEVRGSNCTLELVWRWHEFYRPWECGSEIQWHAGMNIMVWS